MNQRRITLTLSAIAVSALALAGCSDGGGSAPAEPDAAESVLFVNPLPNYPVWRLIGDCMAEQAAERGVDFSESGPTGQAIDATAMIEQIQQGIANEVGAIITLPASEAFGPLLQQARDAGIVTETMYGSGAPDSGADINIGADWTAQGQMVIDQVAEIEGTKYVGLIAAGDTGVGGSWLDGVKAAAAEYDDIEIVGEVYTGDDSSKALTQVTALLTAHPEINVIATHMGTVTQGGVTALEQAGRLDVKFLAGGKDNGGIEGLESGAIYRLLLGDFCQVGKDTLDAAVDYIESGEGPAEVPIFISTSNDQSLRYTDLEEARELLAKGWS